MENSLYTSYSFIHSFNGPITYQCCARFWGYNCPKQTLFPSWTSSLVEKKYINQIIA